MSGFCCSPNPWRRALRLATLVIVFTAACTVIAHAQDLETEATATPPYAQFDYSTLTGSGNTITASWVPVVTLSGTIYKNVTIQFNVDSSGNLTIAPGYPKIVPAPAILVANFKAGNYVGPSSVLYGAALITVSGPGVTSGGATEWSLAASAGANVCTYPTSATWYVGALTSNPLYPRIKAAGITLPNFSYGIIGSYQCTIDGGLWNSGALLGLSQTGNAITIVSFTTNGKDNNTPQDQITYTLKP